MGAKERVTLAGNVTHTWHIERSNQGTKPEGAECEAETFCPRGFDPEKRRMIFKG